MRLGAVFLLTPFLPACFPLALREQRMHVQTPIMAAGADTPEPRGRALSRCQFLIMPFSKITDLTSEAPAATGTASRDPELERVLQDIERLLQVVDPADTDTYECRFAAADAYAAPYAVALVYEIRRLDALVAASTGK
jgi:hypothetical protein